MESLQKLAATGETITIDGTPYRLTELTYADYAEINKRIVAQRGDPIAVAHQLAAGLSDAERREIFERAYNDARKAQQVTSAELSEFIYNLPGAFFVFWLTLRKHQPELTEDDATALFTRRSEHAMTQIVDELAAKYPDVSREDIARAAADNEPGLLRQFIREVDGMPSGNSASPEAMTTAG